MRIRSLLTLTAGKASAGCARSSLTAYRTGKAKRQPPVNFTCAGFETVTPFGSNPFGRPFSRLSKISRLTEARSIELLRLAATSRLAPVPRRKRIPFQLVNQQPIWQWKRRHALAAEHVLRLVQIPPRCSLSALKFHILACSPKANLSVRVARSKWFG